MFLNGLRKSKDPRQKERENLHALKNLTEYLKLISRGKTNNNNCLEFLKAGCIRHASFITVGHWELSSQNFTKWMRIFLSIKKKSPR